MRTPLPQKKIKKPADFRSILNSSKSITERGVSLYYRNNVSPARRNRLGVIVSRRTAKKATVRNRLKRVVREFFRANKSTVKNGFDMIVRFSPLPKPLNNKELRDSLTSLIRRAKLFNADDQ